jgi:hypothetical protein
MTSVLPWFSCRDGHTDNRCRSGYPDMSDSNLNYLFLPDDVNFSTLYIVLRCKTLSDRNSQFFCGPCLSWALQQVDLPSPAFRCSLCRHLELTVGATGSFTSFTSWYVGVCVCLGGVGGWGRFFLAAVSSLPSSSAAITSIPRLRFISLLLLRLVKPSTFTVGHEPEQFAFTLMGQNVELQKLVFFKICAENRNSESWPKIKIKLRTNCKESVYLVVLAASVFSLYKADNAYSRVIREPVSCSGDKGIPPPSVRFERNPPFFKVMPCF